MEGSNKNKETVNKLGREMVFCFLQLDSPTRRYIFHSDLALSRDIQEEERKELKPVNHLFRLSRSVSLVPGLHLPCRIHSIPDILIQLFCQGETDPLQVYSSVKLPNGKS
jgi:hypothetical protein